MVNELLQKTAQTDSLHLLYTYMGTVDVELLSTSIMKGYMLRIASNSKNFKTLFYLVWCSLYSNYSQHDNAPFYKPKKLTIK